MIEDEREFDCPAARRRFIAERQQAAHDRTRDDEELRKAQRQVNALAAKKRKRVTA